MHRATILAAVLLVAHAGPATADSGQNRILAGFGPFVARVDFAGLNHELQRLGFSELSSRHWMTGGSGRVHIGRIVLGGSGWGGSQAVASETLVVRVSIASGQFEAGYSVLSSRHLIVTPALGIGVCGHTITVESQRHPQTFEQFITEPGPTNTIESQGFALLPQLIIAIPVKFVGLELRAGYSYTPSRPEWCFPDRGQFPGGPALMITEGHPFAGLNFVFGR